MAEHLQMGSAVSLDPGSSKVTRMDQNDSLVNDIPHGATREASFDAILRIPTTDSSRTSIAEKKEGFRESVRRRWTHFVQKRKAPKKEPNVWDQDLSLKRTTAKSSQRRTEADKKFERFISDERDALLAADNKKIQDEISKKLESECDRLKKLEFDGDRLKKLESDGDQKMGKDGIKKDKGRPVDGSKTAKRRNVKNPPHELSQRSTDIQVEHGRPIFTSDGRLEIPRGREPLTPPIITHRRSRTLSAHRHVWQLAQEPSWAMFKVVEEEACEVDLDELQDAEVRIVRPRASTQSTI